MTQQEVKRQLKKAFRDVEVPVRQEHLAFTKSLANNELHRNTGCERIGFAKFLSTQIRFIGWNIWMAQGMILVAISCFLAASMGEYFMYNPRYVALMLCYLSVLVLMTALPFIYRALHHKMHEIEAVTRFSSVKLLMAKLLIIGIGDVSMLSCILCFAVLKTPLPAGSAILYLLFPFLLASCGLLFILGHTRATRCVVGSIGICVFLVLAFSLLSGVYPAFYQQTFSIGWAAVCLLLVILCVVQFRQIIYRCSYVEMQLT